MGSDFCLYLLKLGLRRGFKYLPSRDQNPSNFSALKGGGSAHMGAPCALKGGGSAHRNLGVFMKDLSIRR